MTWPWLGYPRGGRWVACLALFLAACGGGAETVRVETTVHVVRGNDRERLGVHPDEERVASAAASLQKTLGHAVAIDVDAALTPSTKSAVVTQTADSLEALAQYFGELARRDPLLFDFVREKLTRVAARYRASAEYERTELEDATGTLVCTMREAPWRGWTPGFVSLDAALTNALDRSLVARFHAVGPKGVADRDLDAYFRYVRLVPGDPHRADSEDDRLERLRRVALFEVEVRKKPIHGEVEQYLASDFGWLRDELMRGASRAPARAALARWITDRFFETDHEVRRQLYDRLFRRDACPIDPCESFPELDRTRLALGFFQRSAPADEKEGEAFDEALCLYEEKDGQLERNRSCLSVYEHLAATPPRADQLVAMLVRSRRRDFLIAALINSDRHIQIFLDALERKGGPLYRDALLVFLDLHSYRLRDEKDAMRAEVARLWNRRADLRPVFLRIVVEDYVSSGRGDDDFATLPNEYAPFDAVLFAHFLDLGPRAVELAPALWPALARVPTPFEIVAPRLSSYVEKRGLEASATVSALVRRACQKKDLEGLRVIRVVLQNRAKAGDKDSMALALAARDCKSAP